MNLTVTHKYTRNGKLYTSKYTAFGIDDARQIVLQCVELDRQDGYKRFSLGVHTESNQPVSVMA
jgi:hypothetical protein